MRLDSFYGQPKVWNFFEETCQSVHQFVLEAFNRLRNAISSAVEFFKSTFCTWCYPSRNTTHSVDYQAVLKSATFNPTRYA
jgi:hypothetical protein